MSNLLDIDREAQTDRHDMVNPDAYIADYDETIGKILSCPRLQSELQELSTTREVHTSAGVKSALREFSSEKMSLTKTVDGKTEKAALSCNDDNDANLEGGTAVLSSLGLKKRLPTRRHSEDASAWSERIEANAAPERRNMPRRQTERRISLDFHYEPRLCPDDGEERCGWGTALTSSLVGITSSLIGAKTNLNGDGSDGALRGPLWQKDKSRSQSQQQTDRSCTIQRRIADALVGSFTSLSEEQVRKSGDASFGINKSGGESGEVDKAATTQTATMDSEKTPSHLFKSVPAPVPVRRSGRRRGHQQCTTSIQTSGNDLNIISKIHVDPSIDAHSLKEPRIDHHPRKLSPSPNILPLRREALQKRHSYNDSEVHNTGENPDPKTGISSHDCSRGVHPKQSCRANANTNDNTDTNHPVYQTLLRAGYQRRHHSNQRQRSNSNQDYFDTNLSKSLTGPTMRRRSSLSNDSSPNNHCNNNKDHPVYKTLHRTAVRRLSASFDRQQQQGNVEEDGSLVPKYITDNSERSRGMDKQVLLKKSVSFSNNIRRRSSITSGCQDDRVRHKNGFPVSNSLLRVRKYGRESFDRVDNFRMQDNQGKVTNANADFGEVVTEANDNFDVVLSQSVSSSNIRRYSSMSEYEDQTKMNHPVYQTLFRVCKLRRSSIDGNETNHPESEQIKENSFDEVLESFLTSKMQRQGSGSDLDPVNYQGKNLSKDNLFLRHSYQPSQTSNCHCRGEDLHSGDFHRMYRGDQARDDKLPASWFGSEYLGVNPPSKLREADDRKRYLKNSESELMPQTYDTVSMSKNRSTDNLIHLKRFARDSNLETNFHEWRILNRLASTKAEGSLPEQDRSQNVSVRRAVSKRERSSSLTHQLLEGLAVELEPTTKPQSLLQE